MISKDKFRNQLVRLAYKNPALRESLLPLLKEAAKAEDIEKTKIALDKYLKHLGGKGLDLKRRNWQTRPDGSYLVYMKEPMSIDKSKLKDLISSFLETFGYNLLGLVSATGILFDPLADPENVNFLGTSDELKKQYGLYHVTWQRHEKSILSLGLRTSTGNRKDFKYKGGRSYLILIQKSAIGKAIYDIRNLLDKNSLAGLKCNTNTCVLLKINMDILRPPINLYKDPEHRPTKRKLMVYTDSVIPPQAISKVNVALDKVTEKDHREHLSEEENRQRIEQLSQQVKTMINQFTMGVRFSMEEPFKTPTAAFLREINSRKGGDLLTPFNAWKSTVESLLTNEQQQKINKNQKTQVVGDKWTDPAIKDVPEIVDMITYLKAFLNWEARQKWEARQSQF